MQHIRSNADFKEGVSKNAAKQQLKAAKGFFEIVIEVIS